MWISFLSASWELLIPGNPEKETLVQADTIKNFGTCSTLLLLCGTIGIGDGAKVSLPHTSLLRTWNDSVEMIRLLGISYCYHAGTDSDNDFSRKSGFVHREIAPQPDQRLTPT